VLKRLPQVKHRTRLFRLLLVLGLDALVVVGLTNGRLVVVLRFCCLVVGLLVVVGGLLVVVVVVVVGQGCVLHVRSCSRDPRHLLPFPDAWRVIVRKRVSTPELQDLEQSLQDPKEPHLQLTEKIK
jgi:hypothetical protein